MDTHGLEQNERLCKEIAEEMVMGQSNALKVSCGVDVVRAAKTGTPGHPPEEQ